MIKKNKNLVFLLPLVIGIWGLVIYRFFKSLHGPEIIPQTTISSLPYKESVRSKKESFEIKKLSRDPFFGTLYQTELDNKNAPKTKLKPWPQIGVQGKVADLEGKNGVYLILINGKTYAMQKGDENEKVSLLSETSRGVVLKFEGERKVFTAN